MAACRTCRATIAWAVTPKGTKAPIDQLADPMGNVMLTRPGWLHGAGDVFAVTLSGEALEQARRVRVPLHLDHWSTCPDKAEWRERQREKAGRRTEPT